MIRWNLQERISSHQIAHKGVSEEIVVQGFGLGDPER